MSDNLSKIIDDYSYDTSAEACSLVKMLNSTSTEHEKINAVMSVNLQDDGESKNRYLDGPHRCEHGCNYFALTNYWMEFERDFIVARVLYEQENKEWLHKRFDFEFVKNMENMEHHFMTRQTSKRYPDERLGRMSSLNNFIDNGEYNLNEEKDTNQIEPPESRSFDIGEFKESLAKIKHHYSGGTICVLIDHWLCMNVMRKFYECANKGMDEIDASHSIDYDFEVDGIPIKFVRLKYAPYFDGGYNDWTTDILLVQPIDLQLHWQVLPKLTDKGYMVVKDKVQRVLSWYWIASISVGNSYAHSAMRNIIIEEHSRISWKPKEKGQPVV